MRVSEVMTPAVECTRPDASLREAAGRMKDLDCGSLPVCGDGDRLVGMITDRDVTVRSTAAGADPGITRVRDVMTPDVVYCFDDEPIEDAERIMQERQIRRLVVLDRNRRLAGIVSLGDLAVRTRDRGQVGEVLHDVSEPAGSRRW